MKLILFSDRINSSEVKTQLVNLTSERQLTIGYISSCPDPARAFYNRSREYYARMGANLTPYFDLESGFDRSILEAVLTADAIHLSGGNTFRFYYWIMQRGLRPRLLDYACSGKVIVGVSAGAIIMTPDISYSEFCGDCNEVGLEDFKGLGLVDFCFVPHLQKQDKTVEEIVKRSRRDRNRVIAASDFDWIVIDDSEITIYGEPIIITNGKL